MKIQKRALLVLGTLGLMAYLPSSAMANPLVVGNAAAEADALDACSYCTFVVNQSLGAAGGHVLSYSFYSDSDAYLFPLLVSRVDEGGQAVLTVTGVGAMHQVSVGVQSFDFDLVEGSDVVDANTFFAFSTRNGAVVPYSYGPADGPGTLISVTGGDLGDVFGADISQIVRNGYYAWNSREYAMNVTVDQPNKAGDSVQSVPEPAAWGMMAAGFGLVGGALRSKRRSSAQYA